MVSTRLTELHEHPVQAVIRLVAAFDDVSSDATPDEVTAACARHGFTTGSLEAAEVDALASLAVAVREVFAAEGLLRRQRLDDLLVRASPRLRARGEGEAAICFEAPGGDRSAAWWAELAGWTALAVWQFGDRLGACATSDCDEVFVDVTRNRSQRHCSPTCLARTHARRRRGGAV